MEAGSDSVGEATGRGEGSRMTEDELALFDLLYKDHISKADREKLKQASRGLLASLLVVLQPMERLTEKEQTQAEVEVLILDYLSGALPNPPYSDEEIKAAADRVYDFVRQRSVSGHAFAPPTAA
jgi:type I restriction enzyme, R subunit